MTPDEALDLLDRWCHSPAVNVVRAEVERLRHDIARHVQIAAEQAEEIERLRTEITEAEQERDRHFSARGRLVGERDQLKAELAAARALLGEVREWIPYYRWIPDLRERVDAIIGKKTP